MTLKCYDKKKSCLDEGSNTIVIIGIQRKITIREISALQMKISIHKGCNVFVAHITDDREKTNQVKLDDIPILKYFKDVFPEEIPWLPMKRDIDFTIDLVLGAVPTSKAHYRMNIVELIELK